MGIKRFTSRTAIPVVLMVFVGACQMPFGGCYPQALFERTTELQHALEPGSTLAVSTASGSIDVAGRQTDQCHAIATIRARAATEEEARELAEQVTIRFESTPEGLEIKADRPERLRNKSVSISYEVTVPHQTNIRCSSASGSLDLRDLTGDVKAHAASGSVKAARITGSVNLDSASGSIRAEAISSGDAHLNSASGSVRLSQGSNLDTCNIGAASGSVTAEDVDADSITMHAASGSIRLADANAGTVDLDTGSGSIRAENLNCSSLKAKSPSGGISIAFAAAASKDLQADIHASSGSVRLNMPPDFAGQVDLSAGSGSVHIDLPVTVKGKISKRHITGSVGQGAGRLSVHTSSGSIRVR